MTTKIEEQVHSYAIGDTVRFTAKSILDRPHRGGNTQGVITASSCINGEMEYGVDGTAWAVHSELEFVSRATLETLAIASTNDEGMGDPDEYDNE